MNRWWGFLVNIKLWTIKEGRYYDLSEAVDVYTVGRDWQEAIERLKGHYAEQVVEVQTIRKLAEFLGMFGCEFYLLPPAIPPEPEKRKIQVDE